MTWKQTLLASCLFGLLGAAPAQAGPHDFVAYVTRLGGDSDVAQPYIDRFTKTIEAAMGWQSGSAVGKFFSTRKDTLAYVDTQKPAFGLMEPALYLELQKDRSLEPLATFNDRQVCRRASCPEVPPGTVTGVHAGDFANVVLAVGKVAMPSKPTSAGGVRIGHW